MAWYHTGRGLAELLCSICAKNITSLNLCTTFENSITTESVQRGAIAVNAAHSRINYAEL
jgi:hypothetical protein